MSSSETFFGPLIGLSEYTGRTIDRFVGKHAIQRIAQAAGDGHIGMPVPESPIAGTTKVGGFSGYPVTLIAPPIACATGSKLL
jgi:hypothetical protein